MKKPTLSGPDLVHAVVNCYGYEWSRYCYREMAETVAARLDETPGDRAWKPYRVVTMLANGPRIAPIA